MFNEDELLEVFDTLREAEEMTQYFNETSLEEPIEVESSHTPKGSSYQRINTE